MERIKISKEIWPQEIEHAYVLGKNEEHIKEEMTTELINTLIKNNSIEFTTKQMEGGPVRFVAEICIFSREEADEYEILKREIYR